MKLQNINFRPVPDRCRLAGLFVILTTVSLTFLTCTPKKDPGAWESEAYPNDWFFAQRAFPYGKIDQKTYRRALQYRVALEESQDISFYRNEGPVWELKGPANIGGRVTDIEMPSTSMDSIYVGTASGGIFLSADQGKNWTPVFDNAGSLSIGDMALAPSDERILYVGTGEPNAGGGSLAYDGDGVYRSDNGGRTWEHLGLAEAGSIGRIAVHPDDPDIVFVAAMGRLFENNEERGVYRSSDGGATWEQVLYLSDSTGFIDLAIDPQHPDTLYGAAWERVRRPDRRSYGGVTSGIYRSVDGGDNWKELTAGLPSNPVFKGRIGLAVAPGRPNVLYASYASSAGALTGLFRSSDYGDTWQQRPTGAINDPPFMWWFGRMFVDPADPDRIYLPSLDMYQSKNGGQSWGIVFSGAHVDQHALVSHPLDPDFLVLGNDGGVYLSRNGGLTYTKLYGLPITQFYTSALDPGNPERLYGGSQDNGNLRTFDGEPENWFNLTGGDGFVNLIDPDDNRFIYASTQYGVFRRSVNGGQTFEVSVGGIAASDRKNWHTPVVFDPADPRVLYYGANRLYRSANRAVSWQPVSPDLTDGFGGGNLVFGTITAIAVSPVDRQLIYAGTDDGNVWRTDDGGNNWVRLSGDLPRRWVTSVVADPQDADVAYVTFSGYRYGEDIGHIYRTANRGNSWKSINGDLPDVPVNDLALHPESSALYAATDVGVFVSENEGVNWGVAGAGLPKVVVTDLTLHAPAEKLIAATYGRSMYELDLSQVSATGRVQDQSARLSIIPNPVLHEFSITLETETGNVFRIDLFDTGGRLVKSIYEGRLPSGKHTFSVDGNVLASGAYLCTVKGRNGNSFSKVVVKR